MRHRTAVYLGLSLAAFVGALVTRVLPEAPPLLAPGLSPEHSVAAQSRAAAQAPMFEVDPFWPKPLPNHWVLGSTIGVSVDEQDHVWIIHRPADRRRQLQGRRRSRRRSASAARPAPPVLEFDQAGNLRRPLGRPGPGLRVAGRATTASPSITRATSGSAATATRIRRS